MGQDKALMPFLGRPLILRILDRISPIADEVLLSTNRLADYAFLDLSLHPDLQPGRGALGGLYTVLKAAKYPFVAAVACDMPFANPDLFEYELRLLSESGADVVIPSTPQGLEPLHAVYRAGNCLPVIKRALDAGKLKLVGWLPEVTIRIVPPEETARFDPQGLAFWNLNTPEEFRQAEERARLEDN
jgi:molybdopterin-guanine dinucleotide biosynthesis protein A